MSESEDEDVILKVSSAKTPGYARRVADAVKWRLREKGFCKARAVMQDAVNTTIKAVAIVNDQTKAANVVFCIDTAFSRADDLKDEKISAISMFVHEAPSERPAEQVVFRVAGKKFDGSINKLADAISGASRKGQLVRLRCLGSESVYHAVVASTIARGSIYTNNLEAIMVPSWDTFTENGRQISVMILDFWGRKNNME